MTSNRAMRRVTSSGTSRSSQYMGDGIDREWDLRVQSSNVRMRLGTHIGYTSWSVLNRRTAKFIGYKIQALESHSSSMTVDGSCLGKWTPRLAANPTPDEEVRLRRMCASGGPPPPEAVRGPSLLD